MKKEYEWKEIYAYWKEYSHDLKRINTPLEAVCENEAI